MPGMVRRRLSSTQGLVARSAVDPMKNLRQGLLSTQFVAFAAFGRVSWRFVAIRGDSWRFVAIRGDSWRFVAIRGDSWRFVAFRCDELHIAPGLSASGLPH